MKDCAPTYSDIILKAKLLSDSNHSQHHSWYSPTHQYVHHDGTKTPEPLGLTQSHCQHQEKTEGYCPQKRSYCSIDCHSSLHVTLGVRAAQCIRRVVLEVGIVPCRHPPQMGSSHQNVGYAQVDQDEPCRAEHGGSERLGLATVSMRSAALSLAGADPPAEGEDDEESSDDGETGRDAHADLQR